MSQQTSTPETTGTEPSGSSFQGARTFRPWAWPLYRTLLQHSKLPILAGPFTGELGLEALYWLPWLAHLRKTLKIPAERLIPIGRGGSAVWAGCPTGIELFAMRTPQDVRIAAAQLQAKTGLAKQTHVTDFDRQILKDTAQSLGLKQYLTLHPAWMYQLLEPFWSGDRGVNWLQARVTFEDLPKPPLPPELKLPPAFTAVRFYARATWPPNRLTADFTKACLQKIATADQPVILLNTHFHADDHLDFTPKPLPPHLHLLSEFVQVTPQNNLWVQSGIAARAKGFVGTYGGFAQLVSRFKVPVVCFYADWHSVAIAHRHLSEQLALAMGVPFHVLRMTDGAILRDVLPKVVFETSVSDVVEPIPA